MLVREVHETGAQLILMAVPSRERALQPETSKTGQVFHDVVREWAARHAVPFIDLSTPFARTTDAGKLLFFDRDIHFTTEGHRVVAETLLTAYPEVFSSVVADADRVGIR